MTRYLPWSAEAALAIVLEEADREGALLPVLHALQAAFGYVPEAAVPIVAEALNLSRADVHGVLTFYHDFRRVPPPAHVLRLCRAEACQARGGDAVAAHAEQRLGARIGDDVAADGMGLEPVYCLGLCASGPAGMLDGRLLGRLDPARLDAVLAELGR